MKGKLIWTGLMCLIVIAGYNQKKSPSSLVPSTPSQAPDYFCTWNIQGYVTSYASSPALRKALVEKNIFGSGLYERWAEMFPRLHKDLYLVLDDDWDAPLNGDLNYYGSMIVDTARFPSVKGMSPQQRLGFLTKKAKSLGWKGLGLWVCAQEAPHYNSVDSVAYWTERLKWMDKAGISYWKVDWGKKSKSASWRSSLTKLGKEIAPRLIIEQSMTPSVLTVADIYRTYDVENVISVPHTIDRVAKLLSYLPQGEGVSIINCEDEPYIAAGTGSALGIMRHPFKGNLPNGNQDHAFPPVGRDLKNRLDEEVRCIMWHRIAVPFAINKSYNYIDTTQLHDYWIMKNNESYIKSHGEGYTNAWQAPAVIARGIQKPTLTLIKGDTLKPYILASRYPNGAIAIASMGRTIGREYLTPRADVVLRVPQCNKPFGIFGHYNSLTIQVDQQTPFTKILAQDLAGDTPTDITRQVVRKGNMFIIPGKVIDQVGLAAATKGDKSEPGMVLQFQK